MDISSLAALALMAISFASAEKAGRVDRSDNYGFQCAQPQPQKECQRMQLLAKDRGCVTLEEYELLRKSWLCPVCDWDEEGLDAYQGYCRKLKVVKELEKPRTVPRPRVKCPLCKIE